jgi:hypothetical protein
MSLGADLAEYLLSAGQMFCLKCRRPQEPAGRMADFVASFTTSGTLVGICAACNRLSHEQRIPPTPT